MSKREKADVRQLGTYSKGILIPIGIIAFFMAMGAIDGGAECGGYPKKETATVQIRVTLPDGNEYIVSEKEKEVTVVTYGSDDPADWEICNY